MGLGGGRHPVGDLLLNLLDHRLEQGRLAAEVVVQRALGDAGGGHDLGQPDRRVPLPREPSPGLGDQRGPGRLPLRGLTARTWCHLPSTSLVDIPSVCILRWFTYRWYVNLSQRRTP